MKHNILRSILRRACCLLLFSYSLLPCDSFALDNPSIDSLLHELETLEQDTTKLKVLNTLARNYLGKVPEKSFDYAQQALSLAEELNDTAKTALALKRMGLVYYYRGQLEKCQKYFFKSLSLYEKIEHEIGIANCQNDIGVIYYDQGNLDQALNYFINAIKLQEELNNVYKVSQTMNNVGNVYKDLGQFEKSLSYYERSLVAKEEIGDNHGIAMTLNNIGLLHCDNRKCKKALAYYERSVKIKREIDDKHGLAMTINNIGLVHETLGDYDKALENYRASMDIKEEIEDEFGRAMTLTNIASVYKKEGNYTMAFHYLKKSLAIAQSLNAATQVRDAYKTLYETYAKSENFEQAFAYHKRYIQTRDSIAGDETLKQIAEIEASYESHKKEREIAILTKEKELQEADLENNRLAFYAYSAGFALALVLVLMLLGGLRKKQRINKILAKRVNKRTAELEAKNRELETFMYKVSHDLKGPVASTQGLINIGKKESNNPVASNYFDLISLSIDKLDGILNDLIQLVIIRQGKLEVDTIYVEPFVEEVVEGFQSHPNFNKINFTIKNKVANPIQGDVTLLKVILRNVIGNAIKFSKMDDEQANVTISIGMNSKGVKIVIADNGIGIKQEYQRNIYDMFFRASDYSHGSGLGLYIVKNAVDKLRGTISVMSKEQIGTSFTITLPN